MTTLPIVPEWQCGQTGDCCRAVSGIRMHLDELAAIARYRKDAVPLPLTLRHLDPGFVELKAAPCPFLSGNTCTVYPVRPFKCRQFQCHRALGEAFDPNGPLGCQNLSDRLLQSRETRRAYALNQRKAQKWALAHGWTGRET